MQKMRWQLLFISKCFNQYLAAKAATAVKTYKDGFVQPTRMMQYLQ